MKLKFGQQDIFEVVREHLADRDVEIPADAPYELLTEPDGSITLEINGLDFLTMLPRRAAAGPARNRQPATRQQRPREEAQEAEEEEPAAQGEDTASENDPDAWFHDPTKEPPPPGPVPEKLSQVELQERPARKTRYRPAVHYDKGAPAARQGEAAQPYTYQAPHRDPTRVPPPPPGPEEVAKRKSNKSLVARDISEFKDPANMDDEL